MQTGNWMKTAKPAEEKKKLQRRGNVFTTQPLMARAPVEIQDSVDKLL